MSESPITMCVHYYAKLLRSCHRESLRV